MTIEWGKMITLPFEEYNELTAISKRYDDLSNSFWTKVDIKIKELEVQVNEEIKKYRAHLKDYYKANKNNYPALEEKYNELAKINKEFIELNDELAQSYADMVELHTSTCQDFQDMMDTSNFYTNIYKFSVIGLLLVILVPYIIMFVDFLFKLLIK